MAAKVVFHFYYIHIRIFNPVRGGLQSVNYKTSKIQAVQKYKSCRHVLFGIIANAHWHYS